MKNIVITLIIIAIIASAVVSFTHYTLDAVVIDIDADADIVAVEDASGNIWEFYGAEGLSIGDTCHLVMFNNYTQTIFDDEIINIF